ncbi:MAG: hydrolase TatD [Deltaproteobacteria bacterium HGW-Deltaproteobacteria-19]|jgi:TatD DNase family protein|nr:MAG: hydrolase TatD [Deltaproteobacteria bacterium HGW-Deltaproteobacteria-19]
MLIDSHAHLEMRDFDPDREEVVRRAVENGITVMVTVGTNLRDCRKAVAIAAKFREVYAAIGIHPHDASGIDVETYRMIRKLAAEPKVVAYGEIGLDFFRNRSPREVQLRRFAEQLDLAAELNLPVIIHDREAHRETLKTLRSWTGKKPVIIHCFSGDAVMMEECVSRGYYISIAGPVTYPKNDKLAEVVRLTPLERLLVETDCPYLTPQAHRGKRNEPAHVLYTARRVAEIRGLSLEEVAEATSRNARQVFNIP